MHIVLKHKFYIKNYFSHWNMQKCIQWFISETFKSYEIVHSCFYKVILSVHFFAFWQFVGLRKKQEKKQLQYLKIFCLFSYLLFKSNDFCEALKNHIYIKWQLTGLKRSKVKKKVGTLVSKTKLLHSYAQKNIFHSTYSGA